MVIYHSGLPPEGCMITNTFSYPVKHAMKYVFAEGLQCSV